MTATPVTHTLAEQLVFSHEAHALYVKLAALHRAGVGSAQSVADAKAFAKATKTDLLSMLGVSEDEVRAAHQSLGL